MATSVPVPPGWLKIDAVVGKVGMETASPVLALSRIVGWGGPDALQAVPSLTTRMNIVFRVVTGSTPTSSPIAVSALVPPAATLRGAVWGVGYTAKAMSAPSVAKAR